MKVDAMTAKKRIAVKDDSGYREFACDVCGSRDAIELPHVRDYTNAQLIHICKNCGFIYVKKRRPFDKIAEIWSKELFGKTYTSKTPLMLARHYYVAEYIEQAVGLRYKELCDIGAGEGQFLNIARKDYGASVFGIEPSSENCAIMERIGIRCFRGALEDYIKKSKTAGYRADIATLMWTLENTTSPRDILMGAREILKDGGCVVVATGSRILVPFAKPLDLYLSAGPIDAHPSRFSVKTLTSLLNTCGFETKHVNPYINDSLTLCVIAKKAGLSGKADIEKDDYKKVRDFFERWHKDSLFYKKDGIRTASFTKMSQGPTKRYTAKRRTLRRAGDV